MQDYNLAIDAELIKALRNDDASSFQTLYKLYWKDLYKMAYARFRNEPDTEDAVQEIFIRIWEIRHTLEIKTSLKAYMLNALKFRIIRVLSRGKLHEKAMEHLVYRMTEMQASILDVINASDLEKTISQVIATFPVNMQKVFVLRSEDYTVKEIAEALGLAEQTVRNNMRESLRRLKIALEKEHPGVSATICSAITCLILNQ